MPQHPFTRLAIVNRGEPAMRLIHAVRELNAQRDEPIVLIALFTEVERHAMFVREADEAVCLDRPDGRHRSGYLDHGALERALIAARADAAWVGWGFVAEDPAFADLCERLGIVFVGPEPAVMRLVGDKIAAKRLAEECGVPVAPWSNGPVDTVEDALRHATRIGFPLMVKATAGGGGRGIRRVDDAGRPGGRVQSARAEAEQAFGDGTLLLERMVTPARHIEVQVIADGQGAAWALGVRDCSCQRRHQKVIEESASPALTAEQNAELRAAAQRLALRAGYRNACTVEFLYEPGDAPFLVHGGQRPPAGRAPRHRAGDRARPREVAAARRRRRPPGRRAAGRPRARRRGAAERRGSGARLPAHSRPRRAAAAADRAERARRHRRGRGRRDPRPTSTR